MIELDTCDNIWITYEVLGHEYEVEFWVADIIDAYNEGGETAVDALIDEYVGDDFNQRISYSYDGDKLMERIEDRYGVEFN